MRVRAFQDGVQVFEPFAHFGGHRAVVDVVQNRLVIFVDQHHGALAGFLMRLGDQVYKAARQVGLGQACG